MLELFEVGPCEDDYQLGFLIGRRFSGLVRSRLAKDLILQNQLLPFSKTLEGRSLIEELSNTNRNKFLRYWDELRGIADGSGVPMLDIILINFRKEILPFIPKVQVDFATNAPDDCSDVLVVAHSMAMVAHNEDANVALLGHTYLIKGMLSNGLSFIAYTYAGELPSCAFGINNHGLAFTLNSVPPAEEDIAAGGIGRNFISRDLLEAESIEDALTRIRSSDVSVGHSYNLIEFRTRRVLNVETASCSRISVHEVGETPFFHANMYLHLKIRQVHDKNSISRHKRAAVLPKESKTDFLLLLGDTDDQRYPIYMTGPTLYTLCTAVIDLDRETLSVIQGNPKFIKSNHMVINTSHGPSSSAPRVKPGEQVKEAKCSRVTVHSSRLSCLKSNFRDWNARVNIVQATTSTQTAKAVATFESGIEFISSCGFPPITTTFHKLESNFSLVVVLLDIEAEGERWQLRHSGGFYNSTGTSQKQPSSTLKVLTSLSMYVLFVGLSSSLALSSLPSCNPPVIMCCRAATIRCCHLQ